MQQLHNQTAHVIVMDMYLDHLMRTNNIQQWIKVIGEGGY